MQAQHYPLTPSPQRLYGALRFLKCAPDDSVLEDCAYLEFLRAATDVNPGSPMIAMGTLGQNASYLFCDIDPESTETLRTASESPNAQVKSLCQFARPKTDSIVVPCALFTRRLRDQTRDRVADNGLS